MSQETPQSQQDISEIFSVVSDFDGDQILLDMFLNACDCAYHI